MQSGFVGLILFFLLVSVLRWFFFKVGPEIMGLWVRTWSGTERSAPAASLLGHIWCLGGVGLSQWESSAATQGDYRWSGGGPVNLRSCWGSGTIRDRQGPSRTLERRCGYTVRADPPVPSAFRRICLISLQVSGVLIPESHTQTSSAMRTIPSFPGHQSFLCVSR